MISWAGVSNGLVSWIFTLVEGLGVEDEPAITGGIAKNSGVVKRLEDELGVKALTPKYDTQLAGAIGAALFAKAFVEKEKGKTN